METTHYTVNKHMKLNHNTTIRTDGVEIKNGQFEKVIFLPTGTVFRHEALTFNYHQITVLELNTESFIPENYVIGSLNVIYRLETGEIRRWERKKQIKKIKSNDKKYGHLVAGLEFGLI